MRRSEAGAGRRVAALVSNDARMSRLVEYQAMAADQDAAYSLGDMPGDLGEARPGGVDRMFAAVRPGRVPLAARDRCARALVARPCTSS
jgi:hypothetical protein